MRCNLEPFYIQMMVQEPDQTSGNFNGWWTITSIIYKKIDNNLYLKGRKGRYYYNDANADLTTANSSEAIMLTGELNPTQSQSSNDGTTNWKWGEL